MTEREILPSVVVAAETAEVQPTVTHPRTLAATLQGKVDLLTPTELRAVVAADALRGTVHTKEVLFRAHIFLNEPGGVLRSMDLGYEVDETVDARDLVRTTPRYERLWRQHQLLMQPKFAEVAVYKRAKKTHAKIAEKLGVEKHEVDKISIRLADFGIIEQGTQAKNFAQFCKKVEKADQQAEGHPLSTKELAAALTASDQRVRDARKRNRLQGKSSTPGKVDLTEQASRIRSAIIAAPDKNDSELATELVGVSQRQVQWQRFALLTAGVVQRKRSPGPLEDGSQGRPSIRFEDKEKFRTALDKALVNKEPVVLPKLRRDLKLRVSITTVQNFYREIAAEQDVPPLLRNLLSEAKKNARLKLQ